MIGRVLLLLGSILLTLIAFELGLRIARGPEALWQWPNLVLQARIGTAAKPQERRFVYDPLLGYVQRAGYTSAKMNYDAEGFRRMPPLPASAAGAADLPPVLATGDSYTQGDEVDDSETWPAYLQGLIGRRVINAGVAAYGLDQTVLRTERLAPLVRPAAIVVGFIADDVRRSEMSRTWGTEKPYFEVKDGKLELRNVPVPASPDPRDTLSFLQHAFGWSLLVDFVLHNQGWRYEWSVDHLRIAPRGTGEQTACLLMQRLAALKIPTLVVAQYDFYLWQDPYFAVEWRRVSRVVLRCASDAGLATLDLFEPTERAVRTRGRDAIYLTWHLSPAGNLLTAEAIAAEFKRLGMVP